MIEKLTIEEEKKLVSACIRGDQAAKDELI